MNRLAEYWQIFKAQRVGIKLTNIHQFRRHSGLIIEAPSTIGAIKTHNDLTTSIGAHSYIRNGSELLNVRKIGRYCSIGCNVTLGLDPRNHPTNWVTTSPALTQRYMSATAPLEIGHDVWIGHRATVMAGIKIGHGAIIGCDAIVTKNVLPYAIVAGNPAKFVRYRFGITTINELLDTSWWQKDYNIIKTLEVTDTAKFITAINQSHHPANYKSIFMLGKKVYKKRPSNLTPD